MPEILGVRIDAIKSDELEPKLRSFLLNDGLHKVFTPNAEIILKAHRDGPFREALNRGELNLADGVSLIFASRFLNFFDKKCVQKIENRITGVDTLLLLSRIASDEEKKVLLFGSEPGVAEKAAETMRKHRPGLSVKGFDPGIVRFTEGKWQFEQGSIDTIKAENPDIIAVALGHGKQEHFICSALSDIPSLKIAIGIGGALDYISGNVKRAPIWMRKFGLEWLYRLLKQPQRVGRIIDAVIIFPLVVIWDRIKALW